MGKGIEIDYETADRITLASLKDHRKYLKKDLKEYKKGKWLHPDDAFKNAKFLDALELLIPYYGGTND